MATIPEFFDLWIQGKSRVIKALLPRKRDTKPCLVLDLDETLLHSTFEVSEKHFLDFAIEPTVLVQKIVLVYRRPKNLILK